MYLVDHDLSVPGHLLQDPCPPWLHQVLRHHPLVQLLDGRQRLLDNRGIKRTIEYTSYGFVGHLLLVLLLLLLLILLLFTLLLLFLFLLILLCCCCCICFCFCCAPVVLSPWRYSSTEPAPPSPAPPRPTDKQSTNHFKEIPNI